MISQVQIGYQTLTHLGRPQKKLAPLSLHDGGHKRDPDLAMQTCMLVLVHLAAVAAALSTTTCATAWQSRKFLSPRVHEVRAVMEAEKQQIESWEAVRTETPTLLFSKPCLNGDDHVQVYEYPGGRWRTVGFSSPAYADTSVQSVVRMTGDGNACDPTVLVSEYAHP